MEQLSHSTPEISTAQRYRRMRRLRIEEENEKKAMINNPEKPTLNYSVVYHSPLLQRKRPCYDFTFKV
jgi:hypothetical protein